MGEGLDLLIYLDENLIRNLSSVFFNGYIDIKTHREINDKSFSGKVHRENREQIYDEDRCLKDIREGYKGKSYTEVATYQSSNENDNFFETSNYFRKEDEIKQIYTGFSIHRQLIKGLSTSGLLRNITEISICNNDVAEGEYIELYGSISSISIVSYLETLTNILSCYGTENLNGLLLNKELGKLDYTKILNILNYSLLLLTKNNTQDLLIECNSATIIITVNINFFLNQNASIFDKVNCPCKIIGKVIKNCMDKSKISLLRKTTQFEYYEKLFKSINPFLQLLENNGILLPTMPKLTIDEKYLLVVPLSIYI